MDPNAPAIPQIWHQQTQTGPAHMSCLGRRSGSHNLSVVNTESEDGSKMRLFRAAFYRWTEEEMSCFCQLSVVSGSQHGKFLFSKTTESETRRPLFEGFEEYFFDIVHRELETSNVAMQLGVFKSEACKSTCNDDIYAGSFEHDISCFQFSMSTIIGRHRAT